jgi:hypothetical protein
MMSSSVKIELIRDLRKSAKEEQIAISTYKKRASFAAKHNLPLLKEYRHIIKDETEHYHSFMREIVRIKRLQ